MKDNNNAYQNYTVVQWVWVVADVDVGGGIGVGVALVSINACVSSCLYTSCLQKSKNKTTKRRHRLFLPYGKEEDVRLQERWRRKWGKHGTQHIAHNFVCCFVLL